MKLVDSIQSFLKDKNWLQTDNYHLSCWLFVKILAVVHFFAFLSFGLQAEGLLGEEGILPIESFLSALQAKLGLSAYFSYPSVFWLSSSDLMLHLVALVGISLSILLFFNIYRRVVLFLLFFLYLSIVTAGQAFYAYQWDSLLLEVTFLSIFLSSSSKLMIWIFRWLLFRLMFLSGLAKIMSGDPLWRNFEALQYHYFTQPLPTVFAWYVDKLPDWFHKISTGLALAIELIVPFFYFASQKYRRVAGGLTVILMELIFLTGNYTSFTILTASLTLFLYSDDFLSKFYNFSSEKLA